jgi:hypothetical protein
VSDTDIAREAAEAIERANDVSAGSVQVSIHDHAVTRSGSFGWYYERESPARAVRYPRGVRRL